MRGIIGISAVEAFLFSFVIRHSSLFILPSSLIDNDPLDNYGTPRTLLGINRRAPDAQSYG